MILQEGDSGHNVELLQKALGIHVDGVFGPITRNAVVAFQASQGLKPDGVVGQLTQAALLAAHGGPVVVDPGNKNPPVIVTPPGMWKPTGKGPIHVIDGYHFDDIINWDTLAANAGAFIHKATTGTHLRDSKFVARWPLIKAHGMRRGAYHWFEDTDGASQFDFFLSEINAAGGLTDKDRILALDYEPPQTKKSHLPAIEAWGERCREKTGRIPWFYCSKSTVPELGHPSFLKGWYNWLAAPSDHVPPVIAPFTFVALHQYAEASFPGMGGKQVDVNRFPGSAEELDLL